MLNRSGINDEIINEKKILCSDPRPDKLVKIGEMFHLGFDPRVGIEAATFLSSTIDAVGVVEAERHSLVRQLSDALRRRRLSDGADADDDVAAFRLRQPLFQRRL